MSSLKILKASAGAGKTFRIVSEILHSLFSGTAPKEIIALTFTRKATAEIRNRVIADLENIVLASDEKMLQKKFPDTYRKISDLPFSKIKKQAPKILTELLFEFSRSPISTIDSFLIRLFFMYAMLLELDSSVEIQDNISKERFVRKAIDKILRENPNRFLSYLFPWIMRQLRKDDSVRIPANFNGLIKSIAAYYEKISSRLFSPPSLNIEAFLKELHSNIKKRIEEIEEEFVNIFKEKDREIYEKVVADAKFFMKNGKKNPLYKMLVRYLEGSLDLQKTNFSLLSDDRYALHLSAPGALEELREALILFSGKLPEYNFLVSLEKKFRDDNLIPLIIYRAFWDAYLETSERDIKWVVYTLNKMRLSEGTGLPPFAQVVLAESRIGRVKRMLIDEFQDTSDFQYNLLRDLMQELPENIVVGDTKQSIYRWRNANPSIMTSKIYRDFDYQEESLPYNFRSARKIVGFNNFLYTGLSEIFRRIQEENKDLPEEILSQLKPFSEFTGQKSVSSKKGGIKIHLLEAKGKVNSNYYILIAECISKEIEELITRKNYRYSDFMILVRSNDEGKLLKAILEEKGLPVTTSATKICLKDAVSNCFFIALFKELIRFDSVPLRNRYFLLKNYYLLTNKHSEDSWNLEEIENLPELSDLINDLRKKINAGFPLTEIPEIVFRYFREKEIPFVQDKAFAFFTEQLNLFVRQEGNSLRKFLEFWETELGEKLIENSVSETSVEILTLHKAKGLERKIVFIPFWESLFVEKSRKIEFPVSLLKPSVPVKKEYENFPLFVEISQKNVILWEKYSDLKPIVRSAFLEQQIENMSLAYVATTRPREGLIIYLRYPQKSETLNNQAEAFRKSIEIFRFFSEEQKQNVLFPELMENFNKEFPRYVITRTETLTTGSFPKQDTEPEKQENFVNNETLPSFPWRDRLTFLLQEEDLHFSEEQITGTYVHKLLQIYLFQPDILHRKFPDKRIEPLLQNFKELLERKLNNGMFFKEIFSEKYEKFPEKTLKENNVLYRPDLISLSSDKVFVLDYKISELPKEEHEEQIQKYKQILAKIYPQKKIHAILVYLKRKELKEC